MTLKDAGTTFSHKDRVIRNGLSNFFLFILAHYHSEN